MPIQKTHDFVEGLARVRKGLKWGFVDKTGQEVITCQYGMVDNFCEGLAGVRNRIRKWGFIDKTGQKVIACQYSDGQVGDFHEGLAVVKKDGARNLIYTKLGFIDKTGQKVVPYQYDAVKNFHEGLAGVRKDDKWGFVDKTGREVVPCQYALVRDFREGLAGVRKDGKWNLLAAPKIIGTEKRE